MTAQTGELASKGQGVKTMVVGEEEDEGQKMGKALVDSGQQRQPNLDFPSPPPASKAEARAKMTGQVSGRIRAFWCWVPKTISAEGQR